MYRTFDRERENTYLNTVILLGQNKLSNEYERIQGGNGDFNSAQTSFRSLFLTLYSVLVIHQMKRSFRIVFTSSPFTAYTNSHIIFHFSLFHPHSSIYHFLQSSFFSISYALFFNTTFFLFLFSSILAVHVGDCILTVAGLEMVSDVTEVVGEGVYTVITMEVSE